MNNLEIRLFKRRDKKEIAPILMDKGLKHTYRGIYCRSMNDVERVVELLLKDTNIQAFSIILEEKKEKHVIGLIEIEYDEKTDKILLAYVLDENYRKKGIMTESLKRVINKRLKPNFKGMMIRMYINPNNLASASVAEKIGAKHNYIYYELQL